MAGKKKGKGGDFDGREEEYIRREYALAIGVLCVVLMVWFGGYCKER